jgi:sec-independent protein translocase protein TatC
MAADMKRAKNKQKSHAQGRRNNQPHNPKLPFIEHLYELRRRVFYIVLSISIWATGAYFVQQHIVHYLLKPAAHQQFIYTSVGGGIDFLFRVCVYIGVVFSIPVIIFQILKYLEPLIKQDAMRFMFMGSMASGVLAAGGMAFGYFVGLPAALHFLLHQFTSDQIHPLLTIQSYMSFVTLYMLGSALLFQLPLLMVLINRVKPLKPQKLLGLERWVILIAFILGGIMNPSPRIQDQVLLAGPMILTYQIGVLIIWLSNRRRSRPSGIASLRQQDEQARAERLAKFQAAQAARLSPDLLDETPTTVAAALLEPIPAPALVPIPADAPPEPILPPTIPADHITTVPVAPLQPQPAPHHAVQRPIQRGRYLDFAPRRTSNRPLPAPGQQLNAEA